MELIIKENIAKKLFCFTDLASGEISGLAKSEIVGDKIYIVDAKIFKQNCTLATTKLDPVSVGKLQYELMRAGEDIKDWNVWWHTHGNGGVFWSTVDEQQIKDGVNELGYAISIVINKKRDILARIDTRPKDVSPLGINFSVFTEDKLNVSIEKDADCAREMEALNLEAERLKNELKEIEKNIEKKSVIDYTENDDLVLSCTQDYTELVTETSFGYNKKSLGGRKKNDTLFSDNKIEDAMMKFNTILIDIRYGLNTLSIAEDFNLKGKLNNNKKDMESLSEYIENSYNKKENKKYGDICLNCGKEELFCICDNPEYIQGDSFLQDDYGDERLYEKPMEFFKKDTK